MKYLIPILSLFVFAMACQPAAEHPADLPGKQALLKEKQKELREVEKLIAQLESEINTLDPNSKKEAPKTLVTTDKVQVKDFERYVDIQSNVQSDDVVMASSETGGRLTKVTVDEGAYVKRGQLIATVDLETIDKQIDELNTALSLASDVYERQKRLWDQNIGSEIQYLQAKNNKERLEKSLETARFQLTKGNVYAPITGVVDMVFLKTGEMSAPGTPIVQILNTGKVKVVADVPEKFLKSVRKGQLVKMRFPALDRETEARVSLVGSSINPANRTFKVEVDIPNRDGLLKPNLLASMAIEDFAQDNAVVIPLDNVQQEVGGKSYVFVQEENEEGQSVAKKIYVKTGESYNGEIIITEGLKGGEALIIKGARGLANNELIQVQTSTTASNG